MGATIPHFGEAVHAVLPFLKHGGDPTNLDFKEFQKQMYHYVEGRYLTFGKEAWQRLHEHWRYVGEVVGLADEAYVEPKMPNGKVPDLVLLHRRHLYVIDLKATHSEANLDNGPKAEAIRFQVFDSAREMRNLLKEKLPTFAFVLRADSDQHSRREMQWLPLGKLTR